MEIKGAVQKDKFGKPFVLVELSADNVETIHEALVKTIQDTKEPEESNIKRMKALEPRLLEIRDQMKPS